MNKLIKKLEDKGISNFDILELVDHKANLITYTDLAKVNNIDEILDPYGACIILFLTRKNYGHWCCLFRTGNLLEFFDPYGLKPDEELNFKIDPYFRKIAKQDYPHLSYLLYHSPYKISYNHFQFQKFKKDVKTCGRHVAVRLMFRHLPLEKYIKLILSSKFDPDKTVTLLTFHI